MTQFAATLTKESSAVLQAEKVIAAAIAAQESTEDAPQNEEGVVETIPTPRPRPLTGEHGHAING